MLIARELREHWGVEPAQGEAEMISEHVSF